MPTKKFYFTSVHKTVCGVSMTPRLLAFPGLSHRRFKISFLTKRLAMLIFYCFWIVFGYVSASSQVQMTVFQSIPRDRRDCVNPSPKIDNNLQCIMSCANNVNCKMCFMIPFHLEFRDKINCWHCNRANKTYTNDLFFGSLIATKSYSNVTKPEYLCPVYSTTKEPLTTKQVTTIQKLTSTTKSSTTTITKKPTTSMKTTTRKLSCPENWFLSKRQKGPWCLRMAFNSYNALYRSTAIETCKEWGAIISGLESVSEADFVRKRTRDKVISTTNQSTDDFQGWGVWINGERLNGKEPFNYTDPYLSTRGGYVWYEGQPDGFNRTPQQNCIQLMVPKNLIDDRFGKLDDLDCNGVEAYAMSLRGVVCGKPAT